MAVSFSAKTLLQSSLSRSAPSAVSLIQKRCESTDFVPAKPSGNLANLRRGTGGRSSFSGLVCTVFGATGFLGRYVVNQLGKIGSQVIVPYRGEPYFTRHLKLAGDLGQVLFMPFELRDEEAIRKCMKYSNVVINLIGCDWETKNFKFDEVNNEGARKLARIAKEQGIEKFIQFSSINSSPNPQSFYKKGGSRYLSSKYAGELAVREEFPEAIILKLADVYGQEDRFLRYYASAYRRSFKMVPLYKQGLETIKMPVHCTDVSKAAIKAILDPEGNGKTFEIVGPKAYVLNDLVEYFYKVMRYPHIRKTPVHPLFRMKVKWMSMMPSYPILTDDKLEREFVSDKITGNPGLADLGITPVNLEDRIHWELMPYRKYNYYEPKVGEFPDPDPPPNLGEPRPAFI